MQEKCTEFVRCLELVCVLFSTALWQIRAVEKRVVSTYFGNIAFAYEDYGLPYCFMASLFNTGINEPDDYNEKTIEEITNDREITKSETGRSEEELPNILFIQFRVLF